MTRITSHGNATLGVTFVGTLLLSLWGANAGTKAIFDALNIIYKEQEKRSFLELTFKSLLFTIGGLVLVLVAIAGVVAVPVALKLFGIPKESGAALLAVLRWPLLYLVILTPVSTVTGQAERIPDGAGLPGAAPLPGRFGLPARCCCRGTSRISEPTTHRRSERC